MKSMSWRCLSYERPKELREAARQDSLNIEEGAYQENFFSNSEPHPPVRGFQN